MPAISSLEKLRQTVRILGLPLVLRSLSYQFRKAYLEARFADPARPTPPLDAFIAALFTMNQPRPDPPAVAEFESSGAVERWTLAGSTVTLTCARAAVEIHCLAPDLVRVRLSRTGRFGPPFSYAVNRPDSKWPLVELTVNEVDDRLDIETGCLLVRVHKSSGLIDFLDQDGRIVNRDRGGMGWARNWVGLWRTLPAAAPVYGLGERSNCLNRRGGRYELWTSDPGGAYAPGDDPLYQSQPWLMSLHQGRAFGLFLDNTFRTMIDVGCTQDDTYSLVSRGGELRYYFIYGPALRTVIERLTDLTGRAELPPLWALGFHQSRWSYFPAQEIYALAKEFRHRQLPCDVIHLDIDYMDDFRCFTWDQNRFPEPRDMLLDLREQGFRCVTMIDPGIKTDPNYQIARNGMERNVFLKLPNGRLFHGPVWPGECYFPDFSNPAVRIWWGAQYRNLIKTGVAGFWNDMNEPAVFGRGGSTLPDVVVHDAEGRGASHAEVHNVYGLLMARASLIGLRALRPGRRPFLLSRSAFIGIQRYAMVWTGDNESTWDHLRLSIPMCLSLGLSGVPFSGPDVGGFAGTPSGELFARWMLAGALFPFYRVHTAVFTDRQEPWQFGPAVEQIARKALELRYRLLPYLYTACWQARQTGLPPLRPLVMEFQNDPNCFELDDQFMVGDAILVAPVIDAGATSRRVYLPAGGWLDYWTGEFFEGGETITVAAPADHLPLYARPGRVIPHYPLIQHTDLARTIDRLILHVFPGNGESELYEDEGDGMAYQAGYYRHTHFLCTYRQNQLTVTTRLLNDQTRPLAPFAPLHDRLRWIIHLPHPAPLAVRADGMSIADWQVDDGNNTLVFETPQVQRVEIWW
jgi:alpha-glucosidase